MFTRRTAVRGGVLATIVAVLLAILGLPTSPARADLQNPRQTWLRNATSGVFLHWGMRTSPSHTSCSGWNNDVLAGGWTPDYWVQETKKLHATYMVLASFHSRLGYSRAWPSSIPGSCATSHDFLGDLLTAAHANGLKLILYMTDDPQWWNEGLGAGQSWLNSSAYSSYKGHTVDLTTRDGFGEFSYDNFFEVMGRYPALDGFWIDNDNAYWESHNLYQQIHQLHPNMLLSNNNEDTPEMDTVSNEQKTGMTPPYDIPAAVGVPQPRLTEASFKLPSSGAWWYDGSNSSVDTKLNIGRIVANAGASIKSLIAETAQVNGRFPSNQTNFNNTANAYLNQIWGSITDTEGGGYMYGGLQPGPFGNGAYGTTMVSKSNPNLHFVHVTDRATSGSSITVRDNGYKVSRITDFRTGATRPFTQANGVITISGITTWDPYDTVLRVETNGREGIYPTGSVSAAASASAAGHGASALTDGNYLTYWDSNTTVPVSFTLDLGSAKKVAYVAVNQREWSPTHSRTSFGRPEDSARIRNYNVQTSTNGTTWTTVRTATMPSRRGVQFIDLNVASTRFVRVNVTSIWAASTAPNYVNKLRIDEVYVGSDYAASGVVIPPGNRLEAENATISAGGTVDSDHAGFSGSGFVNYPNAVGGFVEWPNVTRTAAGNTTLTFRYANGSTADRPLAISVNGGAATTLSFPVTGAWTTWQNVTITVPLVAGANTVRATATAAAGGPNLDFLELPAS
jgi:alpha-L-fucosidase